MSLWEIVTNLYGESYVRAYAWAATEADARRLFMEKHKDDPHEIQSVKRLFDADAPPFSTSATDHGWEF